MVRVISHKATSLPHVYGSIVFARWRNRQTAPYQCCSLLSRFEFIDRRAFPDMSWAGHSPSKLPRHVRGSGLPSNACFLWPTRIHIPKGIWIGSAVFTRLTIVTDRHTVRRTDRPRYSVCNNRPHLRSTAMWF